MIAVIFELVPHPTRKSAYFDEAASLRPLLEEISGFISIERFQSLSQPGKYLSLSFWEDERAVAEWRNTENHRNAQKAGRDSIFEDYRLRVAYIDRDYGLNKRQEVPKDSLNVHDKKPV